MREHLIAFIKAAAARQDGELPHGRTMFYLGSNKDLLPRISFGYQYADPCNVVVGRDGGTPREMSVEDGVDKFLEEHGLSE